MLKQLRAWSKKKWAIIIVEFLSLYFSYLGIIYSLNFLLTWFNTSFADSFALLYSLILLFLSISLPVVYLILDKKYFEREQRTEPPSEIAKQDYPKWKEVARRIKLRKKDLSSNLIISVPSVYLGWVLILTAQMVMGLLARYHYLDFLLYLSPFWLALSILALFGVIASTIAILPMILALLGTQYLVRRFLGYPTDEDVIFAESFIIGDRLASRDRMGARKEVPRFLGAITQLSRNWLNTRRAVYSQELSALGKNRTALCRMIMFSPDGFIDQIGELFVGFGSALRNGDYPSVFEYLRSLEANFRGFIPYSRIQRILGSIERYPKAVTIILIILALVVYAIGYPQIASLIK